MADEVVTQAVQWMLQHLFNLHSFSFGGNKSYNMGDPPLSLPLIKLASSIIRLEIHENWTF